MALGFGSHRAAVIRKRDVHPETALFAALAYPSPDTAFKDEELIAALGNAGLHHLASSLDQIGRWEKQLVLEEQQCLVLARILLHKPRLLVTDESLDATEEEVRKLVINHLKEGLKDTAIINIGRLETESRFFTRVIDLIKDPHGRSFKPHLSVGFTGFNNTHQATIERGCTR